VKEAPRGGGEPLRTGAVRLAVVDDSTFVRKAIERMMASEPRIEVVGTASSGEELLANLERWAPEAITLDLSMPGIGGLVTLDRVMALRPTPVIILSTHAGRGAPQTIEALHRGAADFIDKQQYSLLDFHALREVLVARILAVTGGQSPPPRKQPEAAAPAPEPSLPPPAPLPAALEALLIGASTGGPPAIEQVLKDLGPSWNVPVLVVQHMPAGFTRAFAQRLNAHLPLKVHEAEDGAPLAPGTVLIGPAGSHLKMIRRKGRLCSHLSEGPTNVAHRPSVDELFGSGLLAAGGRLAAVLLTGMGRDGAAGMRELAEAGAFTVAQDRRSAVVYGMPGAAVALQAAREVLPLERIGPRLREVAEQTGVTWQAG
jgi:two-component system, chemotaxis family, protein-glutamate methylesterase/glutaminase